MTSKRTALDRALDGADAWAKQLHAGGEGRHALVGAAREELAGLRAAADVTDTVLSAYASVKRSRATSLHRGEQLDAVKAERDELAKRVAQLEGIVGLDEDGFVLVHQDVARKAIADAEKWRAVDELVDGFNMDQEDPHYILAGDLLELVDRLREEGA